MNTRSRAWPLILLLIPALAPNPAAAQVLPSEPFTLVGGRITIGGEVSASASTNPDDPGWFNYTDYEHNALRLFRLGFSADVRLGSRVSVLGEFRTDNWDDFGPYALYARIRPWVDREFDIQIGRIPPTFGAFARRNYAGTDNPVIGYPLAYQYLTSLRSDAVPASADDLLRMRGRGWQPSYPVGSGALRRGCRRLVDLIWRTASRTTSPPTSNNATSTSARLA
jgi:hypothetical protein